MAIQQLFNQQQFNKIHQKDYTLNICWLKSDKHVFLYNFIFNVLILCVLSEATRKTTNSAPKDK